MRSRNDISENTMWQATVSCDPEYDGIFFYAIKTTVIFCRPSCKSKTPNLENVSFLKNVLKALNVGYRPCKRCRPDLGFKTYDPHKSMIDDALEIIEIHYDKKCF